MSTETDVWTDVHQEVKLSWKTSQRDSHPSNGTPVRFALNGEFETSSDIW